MKRQDLLLACLGLPVEDKAGPLDPLRIMKGLFLFVATGGKEAECTYDFVPYLYGPCSFQVYQDLRLLIANGDVDEISQGSSGHWSLYRLTGQGRKRAETALDSLPQTVREKLAECKRQVVSKTFRELLTFIYKRYPQFAEKAILRFPEATQ